MSIVREQIEQNRRDAAIQRMNNTLAGEESKPGTGEVTPSVKPIFGEPIRKHIQNLNAGATGAKTEKR